MKNSSHKFKNKGFDLRLNYRPLLVNLILFVSDAVSIVVSFVSATYFRSILIPVIGGAVDTKTLFPMLLMVFIIIIGLFFVKGLYPAGGRTGVVELKEIFYLVSVAYVILGLAIFMLGYGTQFSRIVFISSYVFTVLSISGLRILIHNRGSLFDWWSKPVVIIGTRLEVEEIVSRLLHARRMAYKPAILLLLNNTKHQPGAVHQIPTYNYSLENLRRVEELGIKMAIFVNPSDKFISLQQEVLSSLSITFNQILYVLERSPLGSLSLQTIDLEGHPALQVNYRLMNSEIQLTKRLIDLVVSIATLFFTILLGLVIAVLIRIDSPGPIIYAQTRIKKDGEPFKLYKFRTMQKDADQRLDNLLENDPALKREYQQFHKLEGDPRITRVGRILRKAKLDELPQIINVIKGDMSLVGPRPYLPREQEDIGERLKTISRVSPGLTGWWQVMGSTTFNERVDLDIYYISNFSIWLDFYIIIKTLWIILSGQGK